MQFIIRDEDRATERRAPIKPNDARKLLAAGFDVSVERSEKRVFPDAEYADAGCELIPAGSWKNVSPGVTILGLKELPDEPKNLTSAFVHFAHIYKNQTGWKDEVMRFADGGGRLYDLEYLTIGGRRLAAFSYWAGWMGAALGAWRLLAKWNGEVGPETGVSSFESSAEIIAKLEDLAKKTTKKPSAVVIGAKGRSGSGAIEILEIAGFTVTKWDMEETKNLDRDTLMGHDLLVNCVLMTGPGLQLLTSEDLKSPANKIQMIADVSCDPFSDFNPLPIYDKPTTWDAPFVSVSEGVELTSIDNLPSLIPRESSEDFSGLLVEFLLNYPDGEEWANALASFDDTVERAAR